MKQTNQEFKKYFLMICIILFLIALMTLGNLIVMINLKNGIINLLS